MGCDGHFPKGLIKVTIIYRPYPSSAFLGGLVEPRGLYPVCAKYHYRAKMGPFSSAHSLSCHRNFHPICEDIRGIPCACTIGLRGPLPMLGGASMSPCVGPQCQSFITPSSVLIKETHYVMLDIWSMVMNWWCSVENVILLTRLCWLSLQCFAY